MNDPVKKPSLLDETIRIRQVSADEAASRSAALADVLLDCVDGGASVSFMAPLARDKAEAFWARVAESIARGERALFVAEERASRVIVGAAQLVLDLPENQPHRAEVAKVLVMRRARKMGIGAALMRAIDDKARTEGKTLLMLDTTKGLDAERLYERLGWTRFGIVPGHALMPDGRPSDTSFFYKCLT